MCFLHVMNTARSGKCVPLLLYIYVSFSRNGGISEDVSKYSRNLNKKDDRRGSQNDKNGTLPPKAIKKKKKGEWGFKGGGFA